MEEPEQVDLDQVNLGNLPNLKPEEHLEVLTAEMPLAESFFTTDRGREMLRRAYFSCAYNNTELAEVFNTTPSAITAFVKKQNWPAEREQSKKDGEIAKRRAELKDRADQIRADAMEVIGKGLSVAKEEYDGAMIVESAPKIRALVQSISDLDPQDEKKGKVTQSIINVGSQVLIQDND